MVSLQELKNAFTSDIVSQQALVSRAMNDATLWDKWVFPISPTNPVGDNPSFNEDFLLLCEEVHRKSAVDAVLICELAEQLLCNQAKDVRIVIWYSWARLHLDGESGLADGLSLLAALVIRFGDALLPASENMRNIAIEWLASSWFLDNLSSCNETYRDSLERITGALSLLDDGMRLSVTGDLPELGRLYQALYCRLLQAR